MIEINLAPEELRKKRKKRLLPGGLQIPMEVVIGSAGGLIILLFLVHVFLTISLIIKKTQYNGLNAKWEQVRPQKESVDKILQELRSLQAQHEDVKTMIETGNIVWSQKLNILSDSLPKGVWLRSIVLKEKMFYIDGSAISRQDNEMIGVHNFVSILKASPDFLSNLSDLELGSIQSRDVKNIEVADFIIKSELK